MFPDDRLDGAFTVTLVIPSYPLSTLTTVGNAVGVVTLVCSAGAYDPVTPAMFTPLLILDALRLRGAVTVTLVIASYPTSGVTTVGNAVACVVFS